MTAPATSRPKTLHPDASGLVRLDRSSCYAQILLALSQDDAHPTKLETLLRRLPFAVQSVRDSLGMLHAHGFVRKVSTAHYVTCYAPLPGVDS